MEIREQAWTTTSNDCRGLELALGTQEPHGKGLP